MEKGLKKGLLFFNFIFLWMFVTLLTPLDPNKAITQYKLDVWNVKRGFPDDLVSTMTQTRDGYIWLGTRDGLVRFNGVGFKVFSEDNTKGFKGKFIRSLYEDRKGRLWIGTNLGGLTCFTGDGFTAYSAKDFPGFRAISCIIEDHEGGLWIGSFGNGVTALKNGTFITYTQEDGLTSNNIYAAERDKRGNLWFATDAGLTKRTPSGRFIPYTTAEGLPHNYVFALRENNRGELWIATSHALSLFKTGQSIHYETRKVLPNPTIVSLYIDRSQSLWIGTDGGGLARMIDGNLDIFSPDDGLTDGFVYSFLEDREGSLWIGTVNGGLLRLSDTKFTNFTTREGLAHDDVKCVYQDRARNLWVGTNGGLNRFKNGKWTLEFSTRNGLSDNRVYCVIEDRNGNLWIGTHSGLHQLKNGKLFTFTTRDGLHHNTITSLYEDNQGSIWIGTEGGLNRFHNGQITVFGGKEGGITNAILCILKDRQGHLWIGTQDGDGLYRLKEEDNLSFTAVAGLPDNDVGSIYEDKKGVLFVGTHGGLSRLEHGIFTHYTPRDGLAHSSVNCILEDDNGNLWLAGSQGISCVSKKVLRDFARGRINKINPVSYNEQDGMKSRWCKKDGWKTRDGRLWFPTNTGVAVIDPANIQKNAQPPPVIIEEFRVDGRSMDTHSFVTHTREKAKTISAGAERLEFYYTALSFLNPQKIKFKLKLEGYDRDWIDVGNRRNKEYTSLPPGGYTFKVIACNSDGFWNSDGVSFSFYKEPHFYQTTWFYILTALFVIFAVFTGYRFRMRQLIAREKKLSRLVRERTLELEESRRIIEEKNRNILASIEYAGTIQQTMLPLNERMAKLLEDYFVIFEPKDIVSGDFYWFYPMGDGYFIAAVDCTGHGVPGALLSMIGKILLDEIIHEKQVTDPAALLAHLHFGVRTELKQEQKESKTQDGMDAALCLVDLKKGKLTFAGAKRPLYYVTGSQLMEIKGDRKSIGGLQKEEEHSFTNHNIDIHSDTVIYLTTDGFADQNDPGNRKFGTRRLKSFLESHAHMNMARQEELLLGALKKHQGTEEQRDDITVIGIKLKGHAKVL